MSSQILLSGGDKYYSYSGEVFGDVSAPATIPMVTIDNTGLRDSVVSVYPFYSAVVSGTTADSLGLQIKLNDVIILTTKQYYGGAASYDVNNESISLFIPRQSKLEVISLNSSGNNTQIRGANLIGYYI